MRPVNGPLIIAGREFSSRLLLGTGTFLSNETMRDGAAVSGTQIVTVALRRADLSGKKDPYANILEFVDPEKYLLLPNTSGAMNAEEAGAVGPFGRGSGPSHVGQARDPPGSPLSAAGPGRDTRCLEILVKEGFTVLPYINADPVLARRLQDVGTATVMPLGSPIGSNRGIETRAQIEIIIKQATVPVVVDAGIGAPSHAAEAIELGADAVLVNTAIAAAEDPVAWRGRSSKRSKRPARRWRRACRCRLDHASATSPLGAFLDTL